MYAFASKVRHGRELYQKTLTLQPKKNAMKMEAQLPRPCGYEARWSEPTRQGFRALGPDEQQRTAYNNRLITH